MAIIEASSATIAGAQGDWVRSAAPTTGTSEVQTVTITGTPTGGTFTLTYAGQTTAPIAYNANAAAVQAALEALSNIGAGNVVGAGGALPGTPVTITFAGALANQVIATMTADGSALTGGTSPAVSVAKTTPGTAGTFAGKIPKGAIYRDLTNAKEYINTGTQQGPVYTVVGTQT